MKKLLFSATLLALQSSSIFAADLPSRKEAVAAPPPPPMWTGFHIGVNAGGTWSNGGGANLNSVPITPIQTLPGATTSLFSNLSSGNSTGFIGGGQIGYDMQIPVNGAGFVAGVEADIQGIAASSGSGSTASRFGGFLPGDYGITSFSGSSSLNYIGTVRGRIGYLVTPALLVYGTGGFAYGDASVNMSAYQIFNSRLFRTWTYQAFGNGSQSGMQTGYTAGGGVEWMFMPNWSAKAEYLYYDLGTASASGSMTRIPNRRINQDPVAVQALSTVSTRLAGNIVRAGVNYHFNWGAAPVVAKY